MLISRSVICQWLLGSVFPERNTRPMSALRASVFGCSNAIAYLAKQRKRMCSAAYLVECRYMQTLELICHSSLSLQRISEDVFWRRLLYDRFNYLIRYWQVIFWNNVSNVGSLFLEEGAFVELQLEPYSLNAERKCIEFNKCPPLGQQRFEWFM